MTGFEIIILLIIIVASATILGYYFSYGQPSLKDMEEEIKEEIKPQINESSNLQVNEVVKEIIGVNENVIKESKPKKRKYYPKKKKIEDK